MTLSAGLFLGGSGGPFVISPLLLMAVGFGLLVVYLVVRTLVYRPDLRRRLVAFAGLACSARTFLGVVALAATIYTFFLGLESLDYWGRDDHEALTVSRWYVGAILVGVSVSALVALYMMTPKPKPPGTRGEADSPGKEMNRQ